MAYIKQDKPFIVPTNDGKLIAEHFGNASVQSNGLSIARMVAPSGWGEPFQKPEFDEYTLVSSGKKLIQIDGDSIELGAGESILIKAGSRVRYSNPFDTECHYWSVCLPSFSIELVNREV